MRLRLVLVALLAVGAAGCGEPATTGPPDDVVGGPAASTTVVGGDLDTAVASTSTMVVDAESTTTTVPVTTTAPTPEWVTLATVLPEPFGTVQDLVLRSGSFSFQPRDAQITTYLLGIEGDPGTITSMDREAEPREDLSLTLTYYRDMTVWDFSADYREVSRGDESYAFYDGEWSENDRWEWPPMGPVYEWFSIQRALEGCVEAGATFAGIEDVAGVPSAHFGCSLGDVAGPAAADVWVAAEGHVMKYYSEGWDDGVTIILSWEVIGTDVHPGEPLPPGW